MTTNEHSRKWRSLASDYLHAMPAASCQGDKVSSSMLNGAARRLSRVRATGAMILVAVMALVAGTVASSDRALANTSNWVVRTSTDENLYWQSVAYGNGTFVAVGYLETTGAIKIKRVVSKIMSSQDGVTWTTRVPAEATNEWRSVTFGNGIFVAVSSCSASQAFQFDNPCDQRTSPVMTSADGITWVSRAADKKDDWWRVAWGNGKFVAVSRTSVTAGSNQAMTSTDGITWTYQTMPSDGWGSVNFGAGKYVAGGSNKIAYSSDGASWTSATSITTANFKSVAYGPAGFVALAQDGSGSDKMMTSTDGVTWAANTAPAVKDWKAVTYGDGAYVAVGVAAIMTSTDLSTWTMVTGQPMLSTGQTANASTWESITFGSGLYAAVASTGPRLMTSGTFVAAPGAPTITEVTPGDGQLSVAFTAPSSNGGATITDYEVSTDGGSTFTSAATTTSPIVVTGLTNGTTYSVQIKARNSAGLGAASATMPGTPAAPNTGGSSGGSTGTTPGGSSSGSTGTTPGGSTTVAPTTTVKSAPTTTVPAAIVAGQTVSDPTVYTTAPKKVSSQSAINVLTSTEARTQKIVSSTPAVCLPTKDEIVFIDEGRCSVSILNAKSGQVLRRMRTTVIDSDVVTLDIGNEVAVLAPIYFDGGSDKVNAAGTRRIRSLKAKIDAAGSVMVVGHSGTLMGDTPENREMSRNRATNTVKEMKRLGATGPFYSIGVGVADPADPTYSREAQNKNRRVVIVLVP